MPSNDLENTAEEFAKRDAARRAFELRKLAKEHSADESSEEKIPIDFKQRLVRLLIGAASHNRERVYLQGHENDDLGLVRCKLYKLLDFEHMDVDSVDVCTDLNKAYVKEAIDTCAACLAYVAGKRSKETLLGFVTLDFLEDEEYGHHIMITLICSRRGTSRVGKQLLTHVKQMAPNFLCKSVHLNAVRRAIGVYKSQGFHEVGTTEDDEVKMVWQAEKKKPKEKSKAIRRTRRRRKN